MPVYNRLYGRVYIPLFKDALIRQRDVIIRPTGWSRFMVLINNWQTGGQREMRVNGKCLRYFIFRIFRLGEYKVLKMHVDLLV